MTGLPPTIIGFDDEATAAPVTPEVRVPAVSEPTRLLGRRRRVADPRTAWINVRCTPAEHAAIVTAAAEAGLMAGPYLRQLGTGSAGPRARRRAPIDQDELARLLGAIGKLGANINQLAHAANATGARPAMAALAGIGAELAAMRGALIKALGRGD